MFDIIYMDCICFKLILIVYIIVMGLYDNN